MVELVLLLIGAMWLFMMIVAGVLEAFGFIAGAFPRAMEHYERQTGDGE